LEALVLIGYVEIPGERSGVRFFERTALVTGAASGIGRAVAVQLANEGAKVALVDVRSTAETAVEIRSANANANACCSEHVADVTKSQEVERAIAEAAETWGGLDAVVANAGINRDGFVHQLTDEAWDEVIRVNLTGAFYVCRSAFALLGDGGSIVATSSISSLGNLGQANYAASKSGLSGLVRTLALEGAVRGIRVNAVAPGFTATKMVESVPERVRARIVSRIPLKRMARPEEIARATVFLASEEASYITGQVVFVDGGLSVGF
jgi:NAD(P)-dependent dehydrogenase (short-subunit alcohol dehydrogenase family)